MVCCVHLHHSTCNSSHLWVSTCTLHLFKIMPSLCVLCACMCVHVHVMYMYILAMHFMYMCICMSVVSQISFFHFLLLSTTPPPPPRPSFTTSHCSVDTLYTCSSSLCSRGLNPPHRVKSISMTTFTEQELGLLKNGGNEVGICD